MTMDHPYWILKIADAALDLDQKAEKLGPHYSDTMQPYAVTGQCLE